MRDDWFKMPRWLLHSRIFSDPHAWMILCKCMEKANHAPGYFQGDVIKPGQFAFSYRTLSDELKISSNTLRSRIKKISKWGYIRVSNRTKYSVITLCLDEVCDGGVSPDDTQPDTRVDTQSARDLHTIEEEQEQQEGKEISDQRGPDHKGFSAAKKSRGQATIEVDREEISLAAGELFRQAGYSGTDGGIFWQTAAVLHAVGGFSEAQAIDAARGCRGSANPPGYFRTSIRKLCPDFDGLLRQGWIRGQLPTKPPDRLTSKQLGTFQVRRPSFGKPPDQQAILDQIERMEHATQ